MSSRPSYLITDRNYLPSLDGWRGVVSLFVMSYHFSLLFFYTNFTPYGYLGVDFFFALSGFIITRQYEASIAMHTIKFKTFAIRRIARLYPLYIASIGFFLLVNAYVLQPLHWIHALDYGIGPLYAWRVFLQLTMLGNLTVMAQPNGPVWSVSVEWIVNLMFFAVVWRYRRIPDLILWIAVVFGSCYLISMSPYTLQTPGVSIAIIRGIVGFTLGSLLFRHHRDLPDFSSRDLHIVEQILFVFILLLTYFYRDLADYSIDYVFQLVLFPALIMISLYRNGWICRIFSLPPITFLGRISYSIYLLHYPLAYTMEYVSSIHAIGHPWLGILYIIVLISLSTLSYKLIERPGRHLGRLLTAKAGEPKPADPA